MTSRLPGPRAQLAGQLVAVALLTAATGVAVNGPPAAAAPRGAATAAPRGATTATTTPNCGPRIKKNVLVAWKCTFSDDFAGSSLDARKWQPITTAVNGQTAGGACFVRTARNISVHGGALYLTARGEATRFTCTSPKGTVITRYSSGQVASYGKFSQTYGRFAVRAKFPAARIAGLQSSLWMWPEDPVRHRAVGEIDIAEWYSNYSDRAIPYLHYVFKPSTTNFVTHVNVPTSVNCRVGNAGAFHEYVAEWTPGTITIKFDGRTCLVNHYRPAGINPFNQPYFVALSAALGLGANRLRPGATPLPAATAIDWVRVWK